MSSHVTMSIRKEKKRKDNYCDVKSFQNYYVADVQDCKVEFTDYKVSRYLTKNPKKVGKSL